MTGPEMDPDAYDGFANAYARHWAGWAERTLPYLDKLGLSELEPGDRLLDLCCGTGALARLLSARGVDVVGIDGSPEMINIARGAAPDASFLVDDVRSFVVEGMFSAATSTFDALNHVLSMDELRDVFARVLGALQPQGRLIFDLNTAAGFEARWGGSFSIVDEDEVIAARSAYDAESRIGVIDITTMTFGDGGWQRRDVHLVEKAHDIDEVESLLTEVGFSDVELRDPNLEGLSPEVGRVFVTCRKPATGR